MYLAPSISERMLYRNPQSQPDLSDISGVNPVSTPEQTPVQPRSRSYGGIVPSPSSYSSVASLAKRGTTLREDKLETEPRTRLKNAPPIVTNSATRPNLLGSSTPMTRRSGDTTRELLRLRLRLIPAAENLNQTLSPFSPAEPGILRHELPWWHREV